MRRWLLAALAGLVGLPLAAMLAAALLLDADRFRPRLEAAAAQALGQPVRIGAPVSLRLGLRPGLELREVTVTGADGAPALSLARAEARLALGSALLGRLVVSDLVLEGGELRVDPAAWRAARPARPVPAAPAAAPGAAPGLALRAARLSGWRFRQGEALLELREARLARPGPDGPFRLVGEAVWRGEPVTFRGEAPAPAGPWALEARASGATAWLVLRREGALWQGDLAAEAPALAPLAPLAGRPLPALTGVTLAARGGLGPAGPVLETLDLRATGGEAMGLSVSDLAARLPAAGAPLALSARLDWRGLPVALEGEAALPLPGGADAPGALALAASAAGGRLTLAGRWPGPFELRAALPELGPLAAPVGRPLPPLRDLSLSATLAAAGGRTLEVPAFAGRSSAGDLSGALRLQAGGPRPVVTGELRSASLDLAALRPAAAPVPPSASPGPAAPAGPARVIPDAPLDLAALRAFDADLRFALAELRDRGMRWRDVAGRLAVQDGRAQLDPFAVTLPGGTLRLRAAADAAREPPAVHVAGGGEGFDLAALLGALGDRVPTAGRTDLDLDLRGQGATLRAVAAGLSGHLGLAVTEGRLGGPLAAFLGPLNPALAEGVSLACLAVRAEAERGVVRFPALFLDSGAGRLAGEGTLRLADEALAIRLQTDLRLGGLRVRAPVPLRGTLANPRFEGQALLEGALQGPGGPMPDCAAALRLARGGREGPVPAPAAAPEPRDAPAVPPAVNQLLRGLLGR